MKKHFLVAAIATLTAWIPAQAGAQALNVVAYNDGYPEVQDVYTEYVNEVLADGVSTVTVTSDIGEFSDHLSSGMADVYAAFGENLQLLEAWKATVPVGRQYVYFSLDPATREQVSEYYSFSPAGVGVVTAGQTTGYRGLVQQRISQYTTQPRSATKLLELEGTPLEIDNKGLFGPVDWIVDAIVKGLQEIIDKIVEKVTCIANWAQQCLDNLLNELPEDMEVEISLEAQTTPPGVKVSVKLKGTVAQMKQGAKAMAKFQLCQAQCISECF